MAGAGVLDRAASAPHATPVRNPTRDSPTSYTTSVSRKVSPPSSVPALPLSNTPRQNAPVTCERGERGEGGGGGSIR